MVWYQRRWWYIERPFPWLLIGFYAVPVLLILAAIIAVGVLT